MQFALENVGTLGRKINVKVDAKELEEEIKYRLEKLKNKVKIDGFRPGKIPYQVLKRNFEPSVRMEAVEEFINRGFKNVIKEHNLDVTSQPTVTDVKAEAGQALEFALEVEVFPEIDLKKIEEIEFEKLNIEVRPEDLTYVTDNMIKTNPDYKEVDRPSQTDDRLQLKISSYEEGEEKTAEEVSYTYICGAKHNKAEFEAALQNVRAQDIKEFTVVYEENYPSKKFAGKTITHKVKVEKVEEPVYSELNDAFAEKMKVKGGVKALEDAVKHQLEEQVKRLEFGVNQEKVFEKFEKEIVCELPPKLLEEEIKRLQSLQHPHEAHDHIHDEHCTHDHEEPEASEEIKQNAAANLKRMMVMRALIKALDVRVDNKMMQEELMKIVSMYDAPHEALKDITQNRNALSQVQNLVLERQLIDKIFEKYKTNIKTKSYREYTDERDAEAKKSAV